MPRTPYRIAALALLLLAAGAVPSSAATSVGSFGTPQSCAANAIYFDDSSPPNEVTSSGVVTAFTAVSPGPGSTLDFVMFDVTKGRVVGVSGVRTFSAPTGAAQTFEVLPGIAVEPGDVPGVWSATGTPCIVDQGGHGVAGPTSEPQPGQTIPGPYATGNGAPDAVATIEPDADGDGYGDETQDACPTDRAVHDGGCTADVALTQAFGPTDVRPGHSATLTVSVANLATQPASGVQLTERLPAGLDLVSAPPSCAGAPTLTCSLGMLAPGARTTLSMKVRAVATGPRRATATVASAHDPNPANDSATATLRVARTPRCLVPHLAGHSVAYARRMLARGGCRLGHVNRPSRWLLRRRHVHKLVVRRSDPGAGAVLPARTKVAVTLAPKRD